MVFQLIPNGIFDVFVGFADHGLNFVRANVAGHHDHGIFEVHGAALTIGQTAIVQHLQEHVEDVGMGFFYLIQQNHAVGFAAHGLGQVAALFIAHIARRRANQTCNAVLFHEFAHVDADQMVFRVKQKASQRLAQLGFTHTRGAEEQERAGWAIWVRQASTRTANRIRHRRDGFFLTHHAVM